MPNITARAPLLFYREVAKDPLANNIDAIVVLAPDGWSWSANIQWTPEWSRVAQVQTNVSDPRTGLTVEWLPIQDFIYFEAPAGLPAPPIGGNYQGKAYVPPVFDPAQFVADFWMPGALAHLQGATLVSVDQVPAVAEEFKREFGGPADAAAFRMRYEYDQSGQRWEEDVFFALLYSGSAQLTSWYVNFSYASRAPKGVLDLNQGVISTIAASRATTPAWEGTFLLVRQLFTQGIQQQMADTQAFGQLLAQHRGESQALQDQVTQERQASQDRIADLRGQTLSGIQTFVDPISQTLVQLPQSWSQYWVNSQGQYLVSDQAGFDPSAFGSGFQLLQPR